MTEEIREINSLAGNGEKFRHRDDEEIQNIQEKSKSFYMAMFTL